MTSLSLLRLNPVWMARWESLPSEQREEIDQAYSFSTEATYSASEGYLEEWRTWKDERGERPAPISIIPIGGAIMAIGWLRSLPRRRTAAYRPQYH